MAQNYDLTQTGPELQARVDQVFPNRDAIEQETVTREAQDESLETSLKAYTDTEQARAEAVEGALDTRVSANEVDIDLLKSEYEALTQSDIIVGPLPSTGQPNKIYRVPGSTYYTDYMWANGGWVKLAEYSTLDGYVYKGIATPSGTPVQSAEAIFYFAVESGTYTNYGGLVVTNTIAILKYNGTAWTKDDVITIDNEPTAGSDNLVTSGAVAASVVYDISAANAVGGQLATYADLAAALDGGDNVPVDIRKGGMQIKFVQSSDNKYVQFRYKGTAVTGSPNPFLDTNNWQNVDYDRYKSYNYTKNDYTNSLVKEIHIEGTKNPSLKYFVRSCQRFDSVDKFYFVIQSYDPSTEQRARICEFVNIDQSGIYSQTADGYTVTILVILENQNSNDGASQWAPYNVNLELNDNCWGELVNAPIIALYKKSDYQIIQDKNNSASFSAFLSSIEVGRRIMPTICIYKGVVYSFVYTEKRQYTNSEWTNLNNWLSVHDAPYSNRICNVPYTNIFIKDLRLTSGNLGENYVYYIRSCIRRSNKLYIGIKAHNTQDDTEFIVFDDEVLDGYSKIVRNGHTWELVADTNAVLNSSYTDILSSTNMSTDSTLNDFCFSQSGHLLIDLYNSSTSHESRIQNLEDKTDKIWSDSGYTIKSQIPYTLVDGYYDENAELQTGDVYKSVSRLVPCKKGDIIRFDDFYPDYIIGMAFWIYDSEMQAVGSRVNKNNLTVGENGSAYYKIDRDGAAYLGISTNQPEPGNLYFVVDSITDNFAESIKNYGGIGKYVDVLVFAGQSNMAGRGISNSTYPEKSPSVPENRGREFRAITDPTKLYPIVDPFGKNENNPDGLNDSSMKTGSLVPAFVNAYYETAGVPVIAVSASQGALDITQFQPSGAKLQDLISRFNACVQYLENNFYTIRHKYVVWCQGENDGSRVATYESLFDNVLNAFLAAGFEKCLLIRIGRNSSNTSQDGIVNLQTQMAKTNKDIILISTGFAKYAGEGTMKDEQHFYQFAYNEIGRQAGHNAGTWANYQDERTQYDSMHKVDSSIPELYVSDKCY